MGDDGNCWYKKPRNIRKPKSPFPLEKKTNDQIQRKDSDVTYRHVQTLEGTQIEERILVSQYG